MMKFLASLLILAFSIAGAAAQISGPGPAPVPSPWAINGPAISYGGCLEVPVSVTSGCMGNGSGNFSALYVNGVAVSTGGGGGGGVTSVSLSAPSEFTITGSPCTTTCALGLSWAAPVSVSHGGTGATSLTANSLILGNGTSAFSSLTAGTNGQLLIGQTGSAPSFKTASGDATVSTAGAITVASIGGVAPGTAYPLNVGTSANNIVELNGSAQLPAVDGSLLTNLRAVSVPVRQTVLSGPSSAGAPSFLPSTSGSRSITTTGISSSTPLVVAFAEGFGTNGAVDVVGVATTNLTWSSLTASTTDYLGVTVSGSTLTTFSTSLQPIYCYGCTPYSTTNGQYTFDTALMTMFKGNGSSAPASPAVFVGEAVTSSSAVTSTTEYAYQARYDSGWINTLPGVGTQTLENTNIGIEGATVSFSIKNLTAEGNYAVGDVASSFATQVSPNIVPLVTGSTRNTAWFTTGSGTNAFIFANKTTGAQFIPTAANWAYRLTATRPW